MTVASLRPRHLHIDHRTRQMTAGMDISLLDLEGLQKTKIQDTQKETI